MKLFYMRGASSLADHIVLEWVGATYELVRMDRTTIKTPDYLKLNPAGTVPLLMHGDFSLTQNAAILGYLADLNPQARLMGDETPRDRADVMRWVSYLNADVMKAFKPIFSPERYPTKGVFVAEIADAARGRVRQFLKQLDTQLDGREWLTGARSIADPSLFVVLRWAIGTKVGLNGFPNLSRFVRRMHADTGVHASLVVEEGLATGPPSVVKPITELTERLAAGTALQLTAEVVGTVEYREGDGVLLEVRRGVVEIDVSRVDTVFSWTDENYRGQAAIPFVNFSRYVSEGAIRLGEMAPQRSN